MYTVSRTSKRSLGAAARGRTIVTTEIGSERTMYPETKDMAITKNLDKKNKNMTLVR